MRVLVCGDRNWKDPVPIAEALIDLYISNDDVTVVEGCARGADRIAEHLGEYLSDNPVEHHPAQWMKYGKAAGPIRNQEMLDSGIDLVLAFHNNIEESKGTWDMINRATKAGILVLLKPEKHRNPRGQWV